MLQDGRVQHRLTLTTDGVEAMAFLRQEGIFRRAPRPDLILLDLGLPQKDGREVLAEVKVAGNAQRDSDRGAHGFGRRRGLFELQPLGVDAYMLKPVNLIRFVEVVRQLRHRWLAHVILPEAIDIEPADLTVAN